MTRIAYRKAVNNAMLTATGVCTFVTVSVLFVILGYLVYNGGKSLDWNFFTKLPLPPGDVGGGVANAIVGSAMMVGLASLIGLPIGFLGGVYLAEFGGKTMSFTVRYLADLLNGVPSIVIGIFAWTVVVVPLRHFSALAGAFALSLMLIPVTLRSTEQFLLDRAAGLARRGSGVGRPEVESNCDRGGSRRRPRNSDRHDPGCGAHCGRIGAPSLYCFEQSILAQRLRPADCGASGDDL